MSATPLSEQELQETWDAYCRAGSKSGAAKLLGIPRPTFKHRLRRAMLHFGLKDDKPFAAGELEGRGAALRALPEFGETKVYILTSAQNNTHVHEAFWKNLQAYAKVREAEILVSQYSYNKAAYKDKATKVNRGPTSEDLQDMWYDPKLDGYFCNERVELAPGLVFCGEVNILPTAVHPLSGFETYTGRASGIFPHAKIAMNSVAANGGRPAKFNYTTGTCTLRNYIQRTAGLKGEHHHAYSALIVEVDYEGTWFVRQLNADADGDFYDLDYYVSKQEVTVGHRAEAINWGDVHVEQLDPTVRKLNWGHGGILDTLKPRFQFLHDTVDFKARNHHDRNNPHTAFAKWVDGVESVEEEMARVARFLKQEAWRPCTQSIVVDSNHDNALTRWLREADYRTDPANARFFLRCQLAKYDAIAAHETDFHLVEWVLQMMDVGPGIARFLRDDESFLICDSIECGMHGHLGPNGARGAPQALARIGHKANTGHTHSAQIIEGLYVAGTSSKLDMDYNKGPSSWSHSHVVTYANGKRAIITVFNGKWRA